MTVISFESDVWLAVLALILAVCGFFSSHAILTGRAQHSLPILLWVIPVLSFVGTGITVYLISI